MEILKKKEKKRIETRGERVSERRAAGSRSGGKYFGGKMADVSETSG